MGIEATAEQIDRHLGSPLCCHYLSLHVVDLAVSFGAQRKGCDRLVRWAIGVLASGEHELAGVWCPHGRWDAGWAREAAEEMGCRGVETVRVVVMHASSFSAATRSTRVNPLAAAARPGESWPSSQAPEILRGADGITDEVRVKSGRMPLSLALASVATGDEQSGPEARPFDELSLRPRRRVGPGEQAVLASRRRLQCALARRGVFESQREAISFAESILGEPEPILARRADGRRRNALIQLVDVRKRALAVE